MDKERKNLPWTGWVSLAISMLAALFPFLFPTIFPEGLVPYFLVTVPIGIVSGGFAYFAHRRWLILLAIMTGLWPLLYFYGVMALVQLVSLVTWGHYPPADWG